MSARPMAMPGDRDPQAKRSKLATVFGIGMIVSSLPCTLASVVILYLMAALNGHASGRPVGIDAIGLMMMSLLTYAIALGGCVAGLLYFGFALRKRRVVLKTWQRAAIVYSLCQVALPALYTVTR